MLKKYAFFIMFCGVLNVLATSSGVAQKGDNVVEQTSAAGQESVAVETKKEKRRRKGKTRKERRAERQALIEEIEDGRKELAGVDLMSYTSLDGLDLSGANLEGARLISCNGKRVDFSGANLRNAILESTNFEKAKMCNVDLRGADVSQANFSYADLTGAQIDDTTFFKDTNLSHAKGVDKYKRWWTKLAELVH